MPGYRLWPFRPRGDVDDVRVHGKDERALVRSFFDGQEYLYRLVKMLSADSASNGVRAILDPPVPSQNSIRSRNLGRYRPHVDRKQDRNLEA